MAKRSTSATPTAAPFHVLDVPSRKFTGNISINDDEFKDSFVGDMALTPDAPTPHRPRPVQLPPRQNQSRRTTPTPPSASVATPSASASLPDGKYAWVSNVGMFEYPLIPGITAREFIEKEGLDFPAYGIPSQEAEEGVVVNGKKIPGLGSPNHADAMSVFKVDLDYHAGRLPHQDRLPRRPRAATILKTVGGASPSTVAVGSELRLRRQYHQ
jgi:hypothetical protein